MRYEPPELADPLTQEQLGFRSHHDLKLNLAELDHAALVTPPPTPLTVAEVLRHSFESPPTRLLMTVPG